MKTALQKIESAYERVRMLETAIIRKNRRRREIRLMLRIERQKSFIDAFLFDNEQRVEVAILKLQREIIWLRNRREQVIQNLKNNL